MGRFAKVEEAEVFGRGKYLPWKEARYTVVINETKAVDTKKGTLGFVVEFEVLTSTEPLVPPGSKRSWYCDLAKFGAGDMKAFIAQAIDVGHDEVDEDSCEYVVGSEQPLAGLQMVLETWPHTTEKGGPFTRHEWTLPPEAQEVAATG